MLNNIFGAPGTTVAGLGGAAAIYTALSALIPGQLGQIIGGVTAAIIAIVGALAPTVDEMLAARKPAP